MPEKQSVDSSWSNPEETSADVTSSASVEEGQHSESKPAELTAAAANLSPLAGASLGEEDVAKQSYLERIHQLEQALEQSLGSLSQLRSQLSEQQMLTSQLAATEEVASLQQQALAQLKQQLSQQQQAMEAQISKAQEKDQTIQELLQTVETLAESQVGELGLLKTQLLEKRTTIKSSQKQLEEQRIKWHKAWEADQKRVRALEAQILSVRTESGHREAQLAAANQQIEVLYERLSDRTYSLKQLEATHRKTQAIVSEQKTTIAALYRQIEALESELAKQGKIQAQLQQAADKLTSEVSQHQARTTELERQRAALQEQILMQAQQANEYEATIRYWKDKSDIATQPDTKRPRNKRQGQKLQLAEASANPSKVPIAPETPDAVETPAPLITESASVASHKPVQVELPGFLRKSPAAQPQPDKT